VLNDLFLQDINYMYANAYYYSWRDGVAYSGSGVARINHDTGTSRRQAQLVLRRITAFPGIPSPYVTSHSCQLSLLPSAGWDMSTAQSAMKLWAWGVKAGVAHSTCGLNAWVAC